MPETITQLGVGAIFAIMILDRVFAFIGKGKTRADNGDNAGAQTPDFWRRANKEITIEVMNAIVVPILNKQVDILARIEARSGATHDLSMKQGFLLDEVHKSVDKLRATSHTMTEHMQKIASERRTE